ncbi:MAG TPA: CBS domain-containing protein [Phycisphaerae bacterium]|nr:CBS domain-containing protein [Phycisphaerae bacterium]
MICPACKHRNIDGADDCEKCGQSLIAVELPAAKADVGWESTVVCEDLSQVMAVPPIAVSPTTTLQEVVDRLVAGGVGCVLVVSNDKLVGIFSERDLLLKIGDKFNELKSSPVRDYMTPDPETLPPEATIAWALNRMDVGGFRHIPIVKEGHPLAMVSVRDLLQHLGKRYLAASA